MKKYRRFVFALLAFCMLFALVPVRAGAQTVTSGKVEGRAGYLDWVFKDGTLTITGNDQTIDENNPTPWNHLKDQIKHIVFNGSLSIMGQEFNGYPNLESFVLPKGLSFLNNSLNNCPKLDNIVIPDSVTYIMNAMNNCKLLSSLTLSPNMHLITQSLNMTPCLQQVVLPEKLVSLSSSFSFSSLTDVTIPASVESISSSLYHCKYLKVVRFLGNAPEFQEYPNLFREINAKMYYPKGNSTWTDSVRQNYHGTLTWIGVDKPGSIKYEPPMEWWIRDSVLTVRGNGPMEGKPWDDAKEYIYGVKIEKGITRVEQGAFASNKNLTSVSIANTVQNIRSVAFRQCTKLSSIALPDSVTFLGDRIFEECSALKEVRLPAKITSIPVQTFNGCTKLESVVIPAQVKEIRTEAFMNCKALPQIVIPSSVTMIMGRAFKGCNVLTTIDFEGDAPEIAGDAFAGVNAIALYPAGNATWTKEVLQNYGGNITWIASCRGSHSYDGGVLTKEPACTEAGEITYTCQFCQNCYTETVAATGHVSGGSTVTREPTCMEVGIATHVCSVCSEEYPEDIPTIPHTCVDGICTACGNSVFRLAGANRWATALKVADEMRVNLAVEKFDAVIIASGNDFADALAGSYLSTVKNAPILLAWGRGGKYEYLDTDNINYIKANLAEGGTVYILGGVNAVPELYETSLEGYTVKRLGGANRFETNLLILEEAGVAEGSEVLVCTSTNFADSLSASATAKPILLVFNELGQLYGAQPEFLAGLTNCTFTVIGGENAVGTDLAEAIGAYGAVERLAGANRFETSVLVAQKYFQAPEYAVLAYAWNYPDGLCGGALAYTLKAPLILTMTKYEAQAAQYVQGQSIVKGIVLGGESLISDDAIRTVFAMDGPVAVK